MSPLFSTFYKYKNQQEYRLDVYSNSFDNLDLLKVTQSYGIILNDKNEIVLSYNSDSGFWILPGGTIDEGETPIQTLIREVYEESAVVVNEATIQEAFYQEIFEINSEDNAPDLEKLSGLQLRYIAKAERIDKFVSDPGGSMTEVKWVSVEDLPNFLKWGKTVDLIQGIVKEYLK